MEGGNFMKKILVATDGSKNSIKALLKAKELGESIGADVGILNVVKDANISPYDSEDNFSMKSMEDIKEFGNKVLADAAILFEDFKGQVNFELITGDPAESIIKASKSGQYDLIVMGSRGLGRFSRTILGSVSNKVLHHGAANVLIVK